MANYKKVSQSTICGCTEETGGCGSSCLNRVMYYECGPHNCALKDCTNRPFRDLAVRIERDNWFNDGIEIILVRTLSSFINSPRNAEGKSCNNDPFLLRPRTKATDSELRDLLSPIK